jgi:hypothetical protein
MPDIEINSMIQSDLESLNWPDHWRLWIYVSGMPLDVEQSNLIKRAFAEFQSQWTAHGKALKSKLALLHDQVLLIAVDENHAKTTGCSLDKLTQFVNQIELAAKTDFLDRSKIYVFDETGKKWLSFGRQDLRKAFKEGKVRDESLVLDTLIEYTEDIESGFVKPFSLSWHSKIL